MLTVHHLHKSYGIHTVLEDINFSISTSEKLGLVGPNGCGKSTLMRIISGHENADKGVVSPTYPNLRVGYLAQGFELAPETTIQAALSLSSIDEAQLEAEVASLAQALTVSPANSMLQTRYNAALEQLSSLNVHPGPILAPLGLADLPLETPVQHLSGGQKTRLLLARILLGEPQLLLLDEPTNHLDIAMLEWLENWVRNFKGAVLIVSHDRAFLDNTISGILELDPKTHKLKPYPGNYTIYAEQKQTEFEHQHQAFVDQQQQISQLRAAANHVKSLTKMKKGGKADGGDKFAKGFFGNRATKNVAGRAKHLEARIQHILEEEKIDKPRADWQIKLNFSASGHQSREVLSTEDLQIGYTPGSPLLSGLNLDIPAGKHIALTGENGSGKTTLLRTIAGRVEPLAGTLKLGAAVKLGYMTQEQEALASEQTPLQALQAVAPLNETEARHFLHFLLFSGDDPLRPTQSLSYGERSRLQLGLLIAQGCNFLLLDEPINHLDIASRSRFEQALKQFDGTVLAVVHDRYFIRNFAQEIWAVENGSIRKC